MTECPTNHTSSATWIKSNDRTSHQPYRRCHAEGTDRTLSSSLLSGVDQGKNRSKGNAQGVARNDVKGDDSAGCRGLRQPKNRLASPPRYPQVGKTVEGDESKEKQS